MPLPSHIIVTFSTNLKFEKLLFLFSCPTSLEAGMGIGGSGLGNKRHNNGGSLVQKRPIDLASPMRIGTVALHNVTVKRKINA
jgi:hypothetical protein